MSQKDLADALGVDTKTVNNWENGRSTPRNRAAKLRELLTAPTAPLARYDDTELLAELLTRAARRRREERTDEPSTTTQPAGSFRHTDTVHPVRHLDVAYDPGVHEPIAADADTTPTAADLEPDHDGV